ncbi:Transcription factor bHLH145 [Spatholobus suberectus]|nr:Transcription factor bHLH145 [Spatholobus suberectus]
MGEDCGTWVPHLQFGWQSPNLNPLDMGKPDGVSAAMNPGVNMVSSNETMPAFASSALPHLQLGHSNEPGGWLYCLPRFRQGFTPASNFTAEGKPPADHVKGFGDKIAPCGESSSPQKQFLVIDQTGGQTTIVYSSRFGSPGECRTSWHSRLHGADYLRGNEPSFRRDLNLNLNHMTEPTLAGKVDENPATSIESEMHEDTEEINALLYSDSEGYCTQDDDEVTSTGHSPSTMTTHDNRETFRGATEEVASSAGKTNKRKLLDGYYDDIQLMDTASSQNLNKSSATGDDAESRCSSNNNEGSLSGTKKMKKEKIRDVLSMLQSVIPGGKDKDPVILLDDAIRCLKSLKHKAQALGLDALINKLMVVKELVLSNEDEEIFTGCERLSALEAYHCLEQHVLKQEEYSGKSSRVGLRGWAGIYSSNGQSDTKSEVYLMWSISHEGSWCHGLSGLSGGATLLVAHVLKSREMSSKDRRDGKRLDQPWSGLDVGLGPRNSLEYSAIFFMGSVILIPFLSILTPPFFFCN